MISCPRNYYCTCFNALLVGSFLSPWRSRYLSYHSLRLGNCGRTAVLVIELTSTDWKNMPFPETCEFVCGSQLPSVGSPESTRKNHPPHFRVMRPAGHFSKGCRACRNELRLCFTIAVCGHGMRPPWWGITALSILEIFDFVDCLVF